MPSVDNENVSSCWVVEMAQHSPLFWSSEGLKRVAELVQAEAAKPNSNQKVVAQNSGVSQQTITNLLLNLHNSNGRIVKEPRPDTVLKLAPHITNPDTERPFEPEEFLAIARGNTGKTNAVVTEASGFYTASKVPFPAAVEAIRKGMGKRSLKTFAARVEIEPARLEEILTTSDPRKALPKFDELLRLAGEVIPSHEVEPLAALYGFGKVNNGNGSGKLKPAQR